MGDSNNHELYEVNHLMSSTNTTKHLLRHTLTLKPIITCFGNITLFHNVQ